MLTILLVLSSIMLIAMGIGACIGVITIGWPILIAIAIIAGLVALDVVVIKTIFKKNK